MATMMTLGGYAFTLNPEEANMPIPAKRADFLETFGGVAYFSWGTFIEGSEIKLKWSYMSVAMFETLQTKFEADTQIVFTPGDGNSYNVEITDLKGKWFLDQTAGAQFRGDIEATLLIMSEV